MTVKNGVGKCALFVLSIWRSHCSIGPLPFSLRFPSFPFSPETPDTQARYSPES